MERRLIYLDDAIKEIKHDFDALYWNTDKAIHSPGVELAIDALESVDTIDPVKQGKWVEINAAQADYLACSVCRTEYGGYGAADFDYCPSCGARMDAE